jgi:hypothetical protein
MADKKNVLFIVFMLPTDWSVQSSQTATFGRNRRIIPDVLSNRTDMLTFLLWCLLFVFSWPLALAALFLYPVVWLLTLPFRFLGIAVGGALSLVAAVVFLPVRLVRKIA